MNPQGKAFRTVLGFVGVGLGLGELRFGIRPKSLWVNGSGFRGNIWQFS